eukprot:TRINITY_DN95_c0_g4_i1.p1 TRINITY_DN95_c0_g4~~TRINITY_DN95_c0_g4_i1.p1  ORF type:complete len:1494 (-),score=514.86 TRINITY_DN95_c0_g4_i1:205-4686(-)
MDTTQELTEAEALAGKSEMVEAPKDEAPATPKAVTDEDSMDSTPIKAQNKPETETILTEAPTKPIVVDERPIAPLKSTDESEAQQASSFASQDKSKQEVVLATPLQIKEAPEIFKELLSEDWVGLVLSPQWKTREKAITASIALVQTLITENSPRVFDLICQICLVSAKDKMSQVFMASSPLYKMIATLSPELESGIEDAMINELVETLLNLCGSATERLRGMALSLTAETAVANTRVKIALLAKLSLDGNNSTNWRIRLARLQLYEALLLGKVEDIEVSVLFNECIGSFNNASVKVRHAALTLASRALIIVGYKLKDDIKAAVLAMRTAITEQLNTVKPALLKRIASQIPSLAQQMYGNLFSKALKGELAEGEPLEKGLNGNENNNNNGNGNGDVLLSATAKLALGEGAEKTSSGTLEDLPYVAPLTQEQITETVVVANVFGENIRNCSVASEWRPRSLAIQHSLVALDDESTLKNPDCMKAVALMVRKALQDKVLAVLLNGITLFRKVLANVEAIPFEERSPELDEGFRELVSLSLTFLVDKLSDNKPKVRNGCIDALVDIGKIGDHAGTVAEKILTHSQNSLSSFSVSRPSTAMRTGGGVFLEARLKILFILAGHHGYYAQGIPLDEIDENDDRCPLPLVRVMKLASTGLDDRAPGTRNAARNIYLQAARFAPELVTASIETLPMVVRRKIKQAVKVVLDEIEASVPSTPNTTASDVSEIPLTARELDEARANHPLVVKVIKLQFAEPIPEDKKEEMAPFIELFGDEVCRSLIGHNWSGREEGLKELEGRVRAAGCGAQRDETLVSGSPQVLLRVSSMVERALYDTVTKVYSAGLSLFKALVFEYLPTVKGKEFLLKSLMQPGLRAVVAKTGDSKERVRAQSIESLLEVCKSDDLPVRLVVEVLLDTAGISLASDKLPLIGRMSVLKLLIQDFSVGEEDSHDISPLELLDFLLPVFENRNVDVRSLAVDVFATLYANVPSNMRTNLKQFCAELKPALHNTLTSAMANALPGNEDIIEEVDEYDEDDDEDDVSRDKIPGSTLLSGQRNQVAEMFGEAPATQLCSESWNDRREGVFAIVGSIRSGQFKPPQSGKSWEVCLRLLKQVLMDNCVQVRICAQDILETLCGDDSMGLVVTSATSAQVATIDVPWTGWDATLAVGSLVKSLADQLSSTHLRIREMAKNMLMTVASQITKRSTVGRHLIVNIEDLPTFVSSPIGGSSEVTEDALRLHRTRCQLIITWKLRTLLELIGRYGLESSGALSLQNLLKQMAALVGPLPANVVNTVAVGPFGARLITKLLRVFVNDPSLSNPNEILEHINALSPAQKNSILPYAQEVLQSVATNTQSAISSSSSSTSHAIDLSINPNSSSASFQHVGVNLSNYSPASPSRPQLPPSGDSRPSPHRRLRNAGGIDPATAPADLTNLVPKHPPRRRPKAKIGLDENMGMDEGLDELVKTSRPTIPRANSSKPSWLQHQPVGGVQGLLNSRRKGNM